MKKKVRVKLGEVKISGTYSSRGNVKLAKVTRIGHGSTLFWKKGKGFYFGSSVFGGSRPGFKGGISFKDSNDRELTLSYGKKVGWQPDVMLKLTPSEYASFDWRIIKNILKSDCFEWIDFKFSRLVFEFEFHGYSDDFIKKSTWFRTIENCSSNSADGLLERMEAELNEDDF